MSLAMYKRLQESPSSIYSRTQKGWAVVGDKRCYFRSGWELRYANYLETLKKGRAIKVWEYEPETFWFESIKRGVRSYLPDFRVIFKDNTVEYHEVKGYMDDKSKTKLKRMAKYYPKVVIRVIGSKEMKDI